VVASEISVLNKSASVKGYLRFGDDSRNLWSTREAYSRVLEQLERKDGALDEALWEHCITLFAINGWREFMLAHNDQYVIVTGVIQRYPAATGEISMGGCNDLGIQITSVRAGGR
jgi:hypothetical protein